MFWRSNRWVARPEYSHDKDLRSGRGVVRPEIALPLLKNAYAVLCARRLRGCAVRRWRSSPYIVICALIIAASAAALRDRTTEDIDINAEEVATTRSAAAQA